MKILFIRHGQTTGDVEDRFGGNYDDHLSPLGIEQCKNLAEELRSKNIEIIISSPLTRTRETAEIISAVQIHIEIDNDFKERNQYGILTGKIKSEAKKEHPELVEKLKDRLNTIEGAEAYESFRDRITTGFTKVSSRTDKNTIAVMWHGGPMRVLFRDILKRGEIEYEDCCFVELEKLDDKFSITDSKRIKFL